MAELLAIGQDLKELTSSFKLNSDGSGIVKMTGDGFQPEVRFTAAEVQSAIESWTSPPVPPTPSSYQGYSASNPPHALWRPYAVSSAFNQLIAANASLHPNSAAIAKAILAEGSVSKLTVGASTAGAQEWNHPVYFPTETDSVYIITAAHNKEWGFPPIKAEVRLPKGAKPASGSDHHLCVVEASGREVDMWDVTSINETTRTITCGSAGESRITDTGNTNVATAAGFSLLAGVIRAEEWAASIIGHALFCITEKVSGEVVSPAVRSASKGSGTLPATGARLRLAYTRPEIEALKIPPYRKAFVVAMATYGAYIGDTGGNAGLGFQTLSGQSYTSQGVSDPIIAFAVREEVPRNSDGTYSFDLNTGVDWAGRLQVLST